MKKVLLIMSLLMCALMIFAGTAQDSLVLKLEVKGFTKAAWVNTGVDLSTIQDETAWNEMMGNTSNSPEEHSMELGTKYTVRAVAFTNEKNAIKMKVSGEALSSTDTSSKIYLNVYDGDSDEPIVWNEDNDSDVLEWTEEPVESGVRVLDKEVKFEIVSASYYDAYASTSTYSSTVTLTVSTEA